MRRVMVESPYRAHDFETMLRNMTYAHAAVRDSLSRGEAPFAMHLFYPQWLHDEIPQERAQGIASGLAWAAGADVIALYTDHGISPGMEEAELFARQHGIALEYRSILGGSNG